MTIDRTRRALLRNLALLPLSGLAACGGGGDPAAADAAAVPPSPPAAQAAPPSRAWRMGFSGIAPRLDVPTLLHNIDQWSGRAELAAVHEQPPWAELLAGADPFELVEREHAPLVRLYKSKGLAVLFQAELNDGLNRGAEAPALRQLGRSLTESPVQAAWRGWVRAVASVLQPDWIGLASETNLVRHLAPPALYGAVRHTANAAAADLKALGLARAPALMSSVQVETAWSRLPGMDGRFLGTAVDRSDFAFTECLGLSSYPYLAFDAPGAIPADWYSRIVGAHGLPAMVVEGGWSSASPSDGSTTSAQQRDYILRHAQLLDGIAAVGVIQLLFADIDLGALSPGDRALLAPFAHLGLAGADFAPKPALAAWDELHQRARR